MEEEIDDNEEIFNIVIEIKILLKEEKYKNDSIKVLRKVFPEEILKLGETLLNYIGE